MRGGHWVIDSDVSNQELLAAIERSSEDIIHIPNRIEYVPYQFDRIDFGDCVTVRLTRDWPGMYGDESDFVYANDLSGWFEYPAGFGGVLCTA